MDVIYIVYNKNIVRIIEIVISNIFISCNKFFS